MMNRNRRELLAGAVYLFFFAVGTAGHYIPSTSELMLRLTPAVLLVYGMASLYPYMKNRSTRVLVWVVATYIVTFVLEAVGVETGVVFGSYTYGDTLGAKLFAVPLIIGFNWVLVVLGAGLVVRSLRDRLFPGSGDAKRKRLRVLVEITAPLAVGVLAVVFDLLLEPVAIHLDYWTWAGGSVPVRNYIAWFVIAAVTSVPLLRFDEVPRTRIPMYYAGVQFLFIASLFPLTW